MRIDVGDDWFSSKVVHRIGDGLLLGGPSI